MAIPALLLSGVALGTASDAWAIPLKGQKSKKGRDLPAGVVGGPTSKVQVKELSDPLNAESDYDDKKQQRPRLGSPESYYTTPPPKPPVSIQRKRPRTWAEGGQ